MAKAMALAAAKSISVTGYQQWRGSSTAAYHARKPGHLKAGGWHGGAAAAAAAVSAKSSLAQLAAIWQQQSRRPAADSQSVQQANKRLAWAAAALAPSTITAPSRSAIAPSTAWRSSNNVTNNVIISTARNINQPAGVMLLLRSPA